MGLYALGDDVEVELMRQLDWMLCDAFEADRAGEALSLDSGNAWTVGYRYEASPKLEVGLEWLAIDSARDPWTEFYGAPASVNERQVRVALTYRLHGTVR